MSARFFLDEGVAVAVGRALSEAGFDVIPFDKAALGGSSDQLVAEVAMGNSAVLVADDHDMRGVAKAYGIGKERFKRLSLLQLRCSPVTAAARVHTCVPFLRLALGLAGPDKARRMFVEIYQTSLKVYDI